MMSDYSAAMRSTNNHLESNLKYLKALLEVRLQLNELLCCDLIKVPSYAYYQMNM